MSANTAEKPEAEPRAARNQGAPSDEPSNVLVCIDETDAWKASIPHALAVASSFGGEVVLVKVIETPENGTAQLDPVDWEIRIRKARTNLENLAKEYTTPECAVKTRTLEGNMIEQLCACASQKPQDITAVSGSGGTKSWTSRHNMARLVDFDIGSVLMIPPNVALSKQQTYRRIFVPLDGSPVAESAIPKAVALAKAHKSELVICHIMPDPGITVIGPSDEGSVSLQRQVRQRNRQTGKDYLSRVGGRVKDAGVPVTTVFIEGADARRSLLQAARKHAADLIVMASHGQGAQPDVPAGHVASFVLDHSTIPVLMVRKQYRNGDAHAFKDVRSSGVRVPTNSNNG